MKSNVAAGAFSALIYCQALLVFAGVASVLMRNHPESHPVVSVVDIQVTPASNRL